MAGLLISKAAKRAGVSAPTIRYYEEIGLLSSPSRTAAGYRRYAESTVEELRFIRKAQALGFSLDEIGEILQLSRSGKRPCSRVLTLAHQHLAADLRKWDRQQTDTTDGGLCRWIADAEPEIRAEDVPIRHRRARKGQ